ncbi:NADH-quinone oxidoreductase subunit D [Bacteriovoracaceae bacterium]|nr:NADH-quinone oxidoreductase subunit D [Bacteriovoracaceae bacterium]|tara:strand:+ start:48694 stop:49845 length:1152 start_codon:yes stop_codon:yes gene_type:complete
MIEINGKPYTGQEKIKSDLLTLNMGPQHPATHGVLRVEIKTDSEIIAQAIPHLGYLHRCFEKHVEHIDYRGVIPFVDRMDYLASMSMEWGYALTVEKMLGTEVPKRAEYLRVMIGELQRIASHLMFFGTYAIDLGAFSPFLYAFQDREDILRIFEELSGARLLYNYIWLGGVWNDVNDDQLKRIEAFCDKMEENLKKYHALVGENKIFISRTANVGVVSKEMAYEYGATGPVLRGSGVDWDLRKERPYGLYKELDFDVIKGEGLKGQVGDCWDRYYVRMLEMHESIKILRQCLDGIEEGSIMGKVPKVLKVPAGEVYMRTECPRGELGYHLISDGGKTPYRMKVKSSCYTHVSMLPEMAPGMMIADFVAAIGSIDIVLGEVDR